MKMFSLFLLLFIFSCKNSSTNTNNMSINSDNVSTNITELSKFISLKITPEDVHWKITKLGVENSRVPGPKDYSLVAILKYNENNFNELISKIDTNKILNSKIYLDNYFIKDWFSDEIKDSFINENGFYRIKNEAYSASVFYKMPFRNGFCFMVHSEKTIFISLYSN